MGMIDVYLCGFLSLVFLVVMVISEWERTDV